MKVLGDGPGGGDLAVGVAVLEAGTEPVPAALVEPVGAAA